MKIYNNLLMVLISVCVSIGTVFASFDADSIRQSIIALDKTRINIDKELTKQNISFLTDKERYEYDIFLEFIDRQINHYCNKLFQMKDLQGLKDIKTMEEQIVSMEDMLMSSLGDLTRCY